MANKIPSEEKIHLVAGILGLLFMAIVLAVFVVRYGRIGGNFP